MENITEEELERLKERERFRNKAELNLIKFLIKWVFNITIIMLVIALISGVIKLS